MVDTKKEGVFASLFETICPTCNKRDGMVQKIQGTDKLFSITCMCLHCNCKWTYVEHLTIHKKGKVI